MDANSCSTPSSSFSAAVKNRCESPLGCAAAGDVVGDATEGEAMAAAAVEVRAVMVVAPGSL